MKKITKLTAVGMAALMSLAVLAGCEGQTGQTTSESVPANAVATTNKIDTLVVGSTMEIESISRETYNFDVLSGTLTHLALVKMDESGEIKPMMAESFSTEDNKTWIFKIKKGLTWHDGVSVTANDVKFTIEYEESFPNAKVSAVDEQTVKIVLDTPNARFPVDLVTLRVLPEHIFKDVKDLASFTDPKSAIGCGPYAFVKFDENAGTLEFKAYEDYVDGKPNVDKVIVKLYSNADTMYMALQKGDIDMVYFYANGIDANEIENLKNNDKITTQVIPDIGVNLLYFNTQAEPVDNVNIRKALAYAIDYDQMAKLFGSEYATPGNFGMIPKGSYGYIETETLARDVEKAKQFLKKAGAEDSDNDGILEYKGKDLELEVLVRTEMPKYTRMAELLSSNPEEVGVKVVQKPVDTAQFRTISEQEHSHVSMLSRATPWGMVMKQGAGVPYMDARGMGLANVNDKEFQALADKMTSSSTNEYEKLVAEVQNYYAENVPAIPLYWDQFIQAYNSDFSNFTVDGTFGLLNVDTWFSITKNA